MMKHDLVTTQATISADRFVLRPVRYSDVGLLEMHTGDERVARMTRNIPHPLPPGATAGFITRAQDPARAEDIWIMDGTAGGFGEFLGVVGLERMDRDQCEIAFWVVPGLWGSGIATEAVGALIKANPLKCRTVFASVFQDNPASSHLLANLGFEYIGDAEYHSVARDALVPTITYIKRMDSVASGGNA
jgi:RimJ/RimL family protein N-acetyltransferase